MPRTRIKVAPTHRSPSTKTKNVPSLYTEEAQPKKLWPWILGGIIAVVFVLLVIGGVSVLVASNLMKNTPNTGLPFLSPTSTYNGFDGKDFAKTRTWASKVVEQLESTQKFDTPKTEREAKQRHDQAVERYQHAFRTAQKELTYVKGQTFEWSDPDICLIFNDKKTVWITPRDVEDKNGSYVLRLESTEREPGSVSNPLHYFNVNKTRVDPGPLKRFVADQKNSGLHRQTPKTNVTIKGRIADISLQQRDGLNKDLGQPYIVLTLEEVYVE